MDHSEEGNCLLAMQLVTGSVLPAALKTAIELDLLERIKQSGSVSATDLAAQLPTTNPEAHSLLDRLLCLLAAHNILNCTLRPGATERLYSLALVCNYLTRNDDGVSLAPQLLMNNFLETWYHLKDAIIEGGEPFKRAYGMSKFEYCGKNPRANKLFNDAMWNQSTLIMNNILRVYRGFEGVGSLVDVGGGVGASIKMIHSKYPSIKAINFDLPHVIQNAPSHPGVEQVSGDMFVSVPKADEDEGKVIIAERIIPEIPNTSQLSSLGFCPGGKEWTQREFRALAKASGFTRFHTLHCGLNIWIVELSK